MAPAVSSAPPASSEYPISCTTAHPTVVSQASRVPSFLGQLRAAQSGLPTGRRVQYHNGALWPKSLTLFLRLDSVPLR
jgi:hypothetical protein